MDGPNDWDLFAVVRECNNLNDNSSTNGVHGEFSSQPHNPPSLLLPEQRYDPGSDFPNLLGQRRYFGLEEVIDRFIHRNKTESPPQTNTTPPISTHYSVGESDDSWGSEKNTIHPSIHEPQQPFSNLQIDTPNKGSPQTTISPTTLEPQHSLQNLQFRSPDNGGGSRDEGNLYPLVTVLEVPIEKADEYDGWAWQKYGQRRVYESRFPKSYYRCFHEGHKCTAKKHVQRSEIDESKVIITYRGQHSHPPLPSNVKRRKRKYNRAPTKIESSSPLPTTNNST